MYIQNVQVITTTELRTKSKLLVKALQEGRSVELIHRSRVVAEIKPKIEEKPFTKEGIKKIQEAAKSLNLPKISYTQREKIYRKHLIEKYGQGIS